MNLADQKCIPCKGGVPPMERARAEHLLALLGPSWRLNAAGHLERSYGFEDFSQSIAFANIVADIAEKEGHHPNLHVGWGNCTVEIWTHKVNGLTESDFFLAAKAERAFNQRS
jgi:4a-hydroxytetrahydrobiopterin dehydratase